MEDDPQGRAVDKCAYCTGIGTLTTGEEVGASLPSAGSVVTITRSTWRMSPIVVEALPLRSGTKQLPHRFDFAVAPHPSLENPVLGKLLDVKPLNRVRKCLHGRGQPADLLAAALAALGVALQPGRLAGRHAPSM